MKLKGFPFDADLTIDDCLSAFIIYSVAKATEKNWCKTSFFPSPSRHKNESDLFTLSRQVTDCEQTIESLAILQVMVIGTVSVVMCCVFIQRLILIYCVKF
jgi:hypothetical protein